MYLNQKNYLMRYYLFIFLFFAALLKTNAQQFPNLQFENVTANTALNNKDINGVCEDKNGFMWIATSVGLIRYDGYKFKYYFHRDEDKNSLVNNDVQGIFCDSKNRLWVSTSDGLSCFILNENRFVNYSPRFDEPMKLKQNVSADRVTEDKAHNIWIAAQQNFLIKVNDDYTLSNIELKNIEYKTASRIINEYNILYRDKEENEWATSYSRIYLLDNKTKQISKTFNFDAIFSKTSSISEIVQDSKGNYWVSTYGAGVYQFLPEQNKLVKVNGFENEVCYQINEWEHNNQKWVITCANDRAKTGLTLFNNSKESKRYGNLDNTALSLKLSWIHTHYIDSKNNLWISTAEGIYKINAVQKPFDIIPITRAGTINFNLEDRGNITGYFENVNSNWVSVRGLASVKYDSNFILKNYYKNLVTLNEKSNNSFLSGAYYYYQKANEIFITTDSGLVVYNELANTSKLYSPTAFSTLADFRTIVPYSENEILIRSYANGLFVFDTKQKKFTKWYSYKENNTHNLPQNLRYIFNTKANNIYASTFNKGLLILDRVTDKFSTVIPTNNDKYNWEKTIFTGLDEDATGNLWACTYNGIYVYNIKTNSIINHYTEDGQLGNSFKLCIDHKQNVWVNATTGYWCYLKEKNKWIKFDEKDGITNLSDEGIMAVRKNGDVVAGLVSAIAIFHPEKLMENRLEYKSIITEATVGKKQINFILNDSTNKKIAIPAGENSFAVDFAVLNYVSPQTTKYFYKLAPLMSEFVENTDGHINFNGLAPGKYILTVKGADKTGELYKLQDELTINVEPYWYQTNLAKILFTLLIAGLVYYLVKLRIKSIRTQASLKQKITETEIAALKAQMNPHFIFNCINRIDALIQSNDKYNATNYLNKFAKLIRNVLDSSKENTVAFNKDIETLNLYVELEKLRSENKFTTTINVSDELMSSDYKVPPLIVQPFVENAIQHGLRKRKDNNGMLTINVERVEDKIIYHIEDNGIGRVAAAKLTKSEHSSYGMQISNDRIKMFNEEESASINIDDLYNGEQAVGTKVTVQLKIK